MSKANPIDVFASIARANQFREYLEGEREEMYKILKSAHDLVRIHQAQGQLHLIEKQLDLLDKATGLR